MFDSDFTNEETNSWESTNPAAERTGYGCFGKEFVSGYIPFITPQRGGVCTLRRQSKNHGRGAIGAFLGALTGSVPWAFVYHMGYFVAWLGLAIGWLAKKGYELLGGKKGTGKIWIICAATLFGVVLGNTLPDFYEFAVLIHNGEIEGAAYWDIPALYIDWINYNNLWPTILKNLALGLLFGFLGVSSIFRELAAEAKPRPLQGQAPAPGTAEQGNAAPEPLEPALQNFTVTYSGKIWILYSACIGVIVLAMAGFAVKAFFDEAADLATLAISIGSCLFFIALVMTPFVIYFRKLAKFKIDVTGDTLRLTPIWGKERTLQFKDITKAALFPPDLVKFNVTPVFFLKAYAGNKQLFNVNYGYVGSKELLQRLKAEGVPFAAAYSHL